MAKPIKPIITIPDGFAIEGTKTAFTEEKLKTGFDPIDPDVLAGDNLNKFIDDTYKGLNYGINGVSDLYKGLVIYDENEEYTASSIVVGISETSDIALYKSLVEKNKGNTLTDSTKWQELSLGGKWVVVPASSTVIVNGLSLVSGASQTFDVSSILPDDGNLYECSFRGIGQAENILGAIVTLYLNTDYVNNTFAYCIGRMRGSADYSNLTGGSFNILVGAGRTITITNTGENSASRIELFIVAYRKVR